MRYEIKDWTTHRIIGYIDEDGSGNRTAIAFGGMRLGTYYKSQNVTRTFDGRNLAFGDITAALVWEKR